MKELIRSFLLAVCLLLGGTYSAWADTFSGAVSFTAQNRITNNNDGTFKTASNAGNQYALALADLSGLENIASATSVTLEFDVTISGRLLIGIGDKATRGTTAGTSNKSTYNTDGLVMRYGTSDGTYVRVNGGTNNSNLLNKSSHVTFTLDRTTGKYSYTITYVDGESVVQTGLSGSNLSTNVSNATIIEAYTWLSNHTFAISDVSYSYEYTPAAFDYTINAVDSENNIIKELASGTSTEAVNYYYPYAFKKDNVYYTTSASNYVAEATSLNKTINIVYTPDETIVGFYEETTAGTNSAYSNGAYGTVAAQNKRNRGTAAGTLTPGVYKFMGRLVADGNSGRAITLREGTNDPMASLTGSNQTKYAEAEFTVYKTTENLYINGANSGTEKTNLSTSFDYVLIKRIGDVTVSVPCITGFATYANHDYALDFSNVSGLIAYKASVSDNVVTFTPVGKVPAGTGLLLKGETADVPVVGSADDVDVNLLYAPTTAITGNSLLYNDGENYNYILAQPAGKQIGFYRANNSNIAVGKAYLRIPQSLEARQFSFIGFDENGSETTGIVSVNNRNIDKMQRIYDLQGRRIDGQLSKGLYIVDGKKVIVK